MALRRRNCSHFRSLLLVMGLLLGSRAYADAQIITEYPTPNSSRNIPVNITAGSDGSVWFSVQDCNQVPCSTIGQIERITTSGKVTEYSVVEPDDITSGPDGALWFTEGSNIGRITTTGAVTEFRIPPRSAPTGITAGPDGALWFAESNFGSIGRITTSGTITEYPLPTAGSSPAGIAAAPDGALWFTESNKIAGLRQPAPSRNIRFRPPTADLTPSPPGRTARCGSPKLTAARSGALRRR